MDISELYKNIDDFVTGSGFTLDEAASLYSVFLEELKDNLKDFINAVKVNDSEQAAGIIHNIKGISANYHISAVLQIVIHIDRIFNENSLNSLDVHIASLIKEIEFTERNIVKYFAANGFSV